MMKSIGVIAAFCLSTIAAVVVNETLLSESDYLIDLINSKQSLWRAGRNFGPDTPMSEILVLLGVNEELGKGRTAARRVHHVKDTEIPDNFDAREIWPDCDSIKRISDQSQCGSCWAVSTADAMSDRICVASDMKIQLKVSSANLMECCDECGFGCYGGIPFNAWEYWAQSGIVTGGAFNTTDGCQNYPFPPCEHHNATGSRPDCPKEGYDTPICSSQCDNDTVPYADSLTFGSESYIVDKDVEQIQLEIIKNGPVVAGFVVYADFLYYKSGIYQHIDGDYCGHHAVRVIGWGVENEVKYWLVANSWNDDWGDQGLFKIIRGVNECGFEKRITAGLPKL